MRALIAVLAVLAALLTGCTSDTSTAGSVSVLASWTGQEEQAFKKVLAEFTAETGINVDYQGTRAVGPVLDSDLQQGNPPDVAVLPNPGALAGYMRDGQLRPLDDAISDPADSFSTQWLRLQQLGSSGDHLYAVAVKADLKSMIWYDPKQFPGPAPATWSALSATASALAAQGRTPWCVGLEAPPTSGWPGTDWIEDILLHRSGTAVYDRWSAGDLPWTSPEVSAAWTAFGTILAAVRSGRQGAALTNFADSGRGLFSSPQQCSMEHQGSFIMGDYRGYSQQPRPGADFDFFPFPSFPGISPASEVSADLAGLFTDSSQGRRLIRFLAGARAQRIWPRIPGYGAFSPNKNVHGDLVYSDPVSRRIAQTLISKGPLCFDAADLMPAAMSSAFDRAVLEFAARPSRLPELLHDLDQVRTDLPSSDWLERSCG